MYSVKGYRTGATYFTARYREQCFQWINNQTLINPQHVRSQTKTVNINLPEPVVVCEEWGK